MTYQPTTFPGELGIASRDGLTRGVGSGSALESFAETEMRYRQSRLIADARRSRQQSRRNRSVPTGRSRREGVSRWMTWLPSVPMHRSLPVPPNSTACGC